MILSYQCKANKNVLLLSSIHAAPDVNETRKKKPTAIEYYNKNKVGVDSVDMMAKLYTTHCASRRWPLAVWANILDIAAINAHVLYKEANKLEISRKDFILQLVDQLCQKSDQEEDANISNSSQRLQDIDEFKHSGTKRRKCQSKGCRNNSSTQCIICHKVTCGPCSDGVSKITFVKCGRCSNS
jgi:hypothetical protein